MKRTCFKSVIIVRYCFVAAIFIACTAIFAADDGHIDWPASAGNATSAASEGMRSFWGNPAGIATEKGWSTGVFANREWGLNELVTYELAGRAGFSWGTVAMGGSFFGDRDIYTETSAGALYAKRLWRVDIGIRAELLSVSSGDWNAATGILGVGARAPIAKIVDVGGWVDNATASKLDGNPLPIRGAIGTAFMPTSWLRLSWDVYSESPNPSTFRIGQEVALYKVLTLKSGVTFQPNCYHLGLGIHVADFEFDWAYIGHPELGGSTQFGIIYEG
ncbi:hypothetical protein J7L01_08020 [bacterium]|nr:hypothetical protein [bacterium]